MAMANPYPGKSKGAFWTPSPPSGSAHVAYSFNAFKYLPLVGFYSDFGRKAMVLIVPVPRHCVYSLFLLYYYLILKMDNESKTTLPVTRLAETKSKHK